jgi:uncharacterized protein
LQQKLTDVGHPDHTLITYPNLGHVFYLSSQWWTGIGPIQQYVLADLYVWLAAHSGLSRFYDTTSSASAMETRIGHGFVLAALSASHSASLSGFAKQ